MAVNTYTHYILYVGRGKKKKKTILPFDKCHYYYIFRKWPINPEDIKFDEITALRLINIWNVSNQGVIGVYALGEPKWN